jgi:hypothetical protein
MSRARTPGSGWGGPLSSEPHACRCKGLFDGFLDPVKADSGNRGDHGGNRAGE